MGNNMEKDTLEILLRALSGEKNVLENFEKERGNLAARCNYLAKRMSPDKEIWELLGFKFTEIPDDDVLYKAELPKGWKIVETDHHMYKDIVDEKGRKRGNMFYKAAIYDRSAHMSLEPRYGVKVDFDGKGTETIYFGNERERLYTAGTITNPANKDEWAKYNLDRKNLLDKATLYGEDNYPGYDNVLSYWGNPQKDKQLKLD